MRDRNKGGRKNAGPRINGEIRATECRLVGDDGSAYGVVSIDEAKRIADQQGLDLVEISPNARPPVIKLIDYGKFKYAMQKKASETKKKQANVQLKEIQFRPNIEKHDLDTKLNRAKKFLNQGDKVKMVMQFRGREMAYRDSGFTKFRGIVDMVLEIGSTVESEAKMMGNRIICIVAPDKKKIQEYTAKMEAEKEETSTNA